MESKLPIFRHPQVLHNNKALALDNYRQLMQDAITAIPDINFGVHTLIADEEAQRVAVRLEFTGTPVKAIRDIQPTGRPVHFAEHVTYQFREGKIARVWSLVDWVSYREQLLVNIIEPPCSLLFDASQQPAKPGEDPTVRPITMSINSILGGIAKQEPPNLFTEI
ncbi:hypothetical protein DL766_002840 [Monosporascus sp. MC13-8B]|uniref:SnoaL-like domain-containing protein n=1 Tax=Monosporascus cannonballus TaxID=155416 RepID=A0ABY0GV83_9PEZI|nr:hypothetical protein DL762_009099 [Monosporascus cannonballus]RYP00897.1 hypothetical protein DL763_000527 [Monosporascus cannonballus]RYP34727.1 hypothetical protein DL766_002840 [Monosporascus sp. MC13-8B]